MMSKLIIINELTERINLLWRILSVEQQQSSSQGEPTKNNPWHEAEWPTLTRLCNTPQRVGQRNDSKHWNNNVATSASVISLPEVLN